MSLTWPLALLGMVLIPVLLLLERWRRRPRARTWPSLLLWRVVKDLDAPSQRKVSPLLLYECAAILLLTLAAAGPIVSGAEELRIIVLVDAGPHMRARLSDGSTALEATLAEVDRIPGSIRRIDVDGDLVQAATRFDEPVVLATNRPDVEGTGYIVVGRAPDGHNVGIDAIEVKGDKLWFALATDGEPRTVNVQVGEQRMRVKTGVGVTTDFANSLRILDDDNYSDDDNCELRRLGILVMHDSDSKYFISALHVGIPTVRVDDEHGRGELVIETTGGVPVAGVVRGADCIVESGLFDGLILDGCVWSGVRSMGTPPEIESVDEGADSGPLLRHRGKTLAAWKRDGRTLWLGLPLDRDWDEHGTLAVLLDRAKRAKITRTPQEAIVGDAIANPAPGFVDTRGVDRSWDGTIPKGRKTTTDESSLAWMLAVLAVAVLALYARAMLRA